MKIYQTMMTTVGGLAGWFFGGIDGLIYTLVVFVVIDYITGVLRAIHEKKLSSRIGAKGITKKVMLFLLVGVGHVLDQNLGGTHHVIRDAVIFFYIANEGISLLENASVIGLPVPNKIKTVLEQIKEDK